MTIYTKTPPLVILGFGVGDPDSIERWAQEGYLPTIASIMKRGCWGRIAGPERVSEHGTAISLFSGLSFDQIGYYYFRQLKPGTYELESVTARYSDALPFWSDLRRGKKKIAIIDAPETYPLSELSGVQLAN
jgi:predicted AlkP superfamily phosphohydrolase/phosphomutase